MLVGRAIERAAKTYGETVAGAFATPALTGSEHEPFDEKVAMMRLEDELEELDYTDLVLPGDEAA